MWSTICHWKVATPFETRFSTGGVDGLYYLAVDIFWSNHPQGYHGLDSFQQVLQSWHFSLVDAEKFATSTDGG